MPILRTRINYLKGNSTIVEPDSANTQAAASKEDNIEQLPVHKIALILPILVILAGNFLICSRPSKGFWLEQLKISSSKILHLITLKLTVSVFRCSPNNPIVPLPRHL
ncbi:hypothetical protein ACHWQZ_G002256 [Mnemiopsis leidyi]